jgi:hypothetical protein
VNDLQPQMQRQVAILEDRANPDSERFAAGVALPKAGAGRLAIEAADFGSVNIAAMRACRAVWPQVRLDVVKGGGFVLKVRGGEN